MAPTPVVIMTNILAFTEQQVFGKFNIMICLMLFSGLLIRENYI
jgi:hypothetical protein